MTDTDKAGERLAVRLNAHEWDDVREVQDFLSSPHRRPATTSCAIRTALAFTAVTLRATGRLDVPTGPATPA